ncbi:MAG TPA: hypothetical protein VHD55_01150 [Candidatus Paceibacterota bacterium]|nr:hypothetical protein [Candidatus Paceibacterota bacterium]
MNPEIEELKQLVRQSIALSQENNNLLRSMRRSTWVSYGMRFLWIALIIASSVYAYWYVQPYITQILDAYGSFQNLQDKAADIFSKFDNGTTTLQGH